MVFIFFFVLIFLGSNFFIKNSLSKKMLNIYIIWWGILLMVSSYNPYDLYPVSNRIYSYLLLSIFCFTLAFILSELKESNKKNVAFKFNINEQLELSYKKITKSKLFISVLIIFTLIIFSYLIKYNRVIAMHGVEDARNMRFYVGGVFDRTYEIFLYNFFIESFSILVSLYIAFSIVWMKFNKVFFVALIYAYLFSSMGAGRFYIIELIFYIIFANLIKNFFSKKTSDLKELQHAKKLKKKVVLIIFPIIVFLYGYSIYLSNFRKGVFEINMETMSEGNEDFLMQIVIYCVGSFRALEYGITHYADKIGITYGRISFGGIDEFFGALLTGLGFRYEYANIDYGKNVVEMINIGHQQEYNGLFTNIFGMYLDFQVFGIILFSLFWGFVYSKIISFFSRKPNFYNLLIVLFFSVVFMLTPLKWKLQSPSSWIFLFGVLVMIKRSKYKK